MGEAPHMKSSSASLSIRVIELIFVWVTTILAFFSIFTTFSQIFGVSFSVYAYCGFVTSIFITLAAIFVANKALRKCSQYDIKSLIIVLTVGILTAATTLLCHHPDADDYYYIPNAIYHIEHSKEPLDFFIHSLALEDTTHKITSYTWATASAFEYMQAAFAYILNQNYLFFYLCGSCCLIFV